MVEGLCFDTVSTQYAKQTSIKWCVFENIYCMRHGKQYGCVMISLSIRRQKINLKFSESRSRIILILAVTEGLCCQCLNTVMLMVDLCCATDRKLRTEVSVNTETGTHVQCI